MQIDPQEGLHCARKAAAAFAIIGCIGSPLICSAADSAAYHRFGVNGEAVLCPRSSDMDPSLIPYNDESTDLAVGSGRTPGFGFLFDAGEIDRHIVNGKFRVFPEFAEHPYVNKLSGSIGFLSLPDARRLGPAMRARDLVDEWSASGACVRALVTRLQQSDLYELKCTPKDTYSNILNRPPQPGEPLPDPNSLVVATCVYETISAGKFAGQARRACTRVAILDGFIVNYRVQEDNLRLYKQLDAFLLGKIAEWKRNCSVDRKAE